MVGNCREAGGRYAKGEDQAIIITKLNKANWHDLAKGYKIVVEDEQMAKEIIFIVEESAEGGYEARALDHSIFTEGDSLEELRVQIRDAVRCHFEEKDLPQVIRLQ